ncbi:hypothetical protein ASE41_32750 [Streptomyces sp. Root264]|nr:hypothetical protein ASE41_32750 [Streptomyces sp. Root264]
MMVLARGGSPRLMRLLVVVIAAFLPMTPKRTDDAIRSAKAAVLSGIGEIVRGPVADSRPFVSITPQSGT